MEAKETRWRIVIEGLEDYLSNVEMVRVTAEQATKSITQLNEALKELIELRKQVLL